MEFEWDEAKRLSNIEKHDIDFVDMQDMFDGRPERTLRSDRGNERRFITTAIVHDQFYTVAWTRRFNAMRIISARRARDNEERAYRAVHG